MERPRSGIIGVGFMGAVHARAIRAAGGTLSAVAASSSERAESMARPMHASRASASAAALIASDDVDVVHICAPNHVHASLGEQAIAAGKHVICETRGCRRDRWRRRRRPLRLPVLSQHP